MRVIARAWMICMRSDHERTYCVIKSQWSGVVDGRGQKCNGVRIIETERKEENGRRGHQA